MTALKSVGRVLLFVVFSEVVRFTMNQTRIKIPIIRVCLGAYDEESQRLDLQTAMQRGY
jgi:hypothetical protein